MTQGNSNEAWALHGQRSNGVRKFKNMAHRTRSVPIGPTDRGCWAAFERTFERRSCVEFGSDIRNQRDEKRSNPMRFRSDDEMAPSPGTGETINRT